MGGGKGASGDPTRTPRAPYLTRNLAHVHPRCADSGGGGGTVGRVFDEGEPAAAFAAVDDVRLPATRERAALAGFDSHGGASTLLPSKLPDHFGAAPAPNTATSGRVSGEAWERDMPSQASAPREQGSTSSGSSGGSGGGAGSGRQ